MRSSSLLVIKAELNLELPPHLLAAVDGPLDAGSHRLGGATHLEAVPLANVLDIIILELLNNPMETDEEDDVGISIGKDGSGVAGVR